MAAVMEKPQVNERMCNPVSNQELERRWAAVRKHMKSTGLDALVLQCNNDYLGGYFRWFTGWPATHAYPRSLIFPLEGLMTTVGQGNFDSVATHDGAGSQPSYGIGRSLGTPSFVSACYTSAYDAEIVARELTRAGFRNVGCVAPAAMYYQFGVKLKELARGAVFSDATDAIDQIKAVKSPEEIAFIRRVAAMQDTVVAKMREHIRPGMKDFEVSAYAQYVGQLLGSEQGIFLAGSAAPGRPVQQHDRWEMGRELKKGDSYRQLVENNGPAGYYCELGRIFVLGKASQEQKDAVAQAVEAQHDTFKMLKPGAQPRDIQAAHNETMRSRGLAEDKRLYAHGQGYDLVERPLIRRDETMTIRENMLIVCHPGFATQTVAGSICDNVLVGANGV
ncbi:MAG: aminopeptidase P family protein, partial [Burkholderiales bacterium]|nr:aminopeptidase P family protein [Burkholderiales bacterium]